MATPQQALDYAKRFVGRMPVDDTEMCLRILQDSSDIIWQAAPWRWSVAALDIVTIQNGQQDYTVGTVTDCNQLLFGYMTTGEQKWEVVVTNSLPQTGALVGQPSSVSFDNVNKLRLLPVPAGYNEPVYLLTWYKKNPPEITLSNLDTSWETITGTSAGWFHVFQEFVLYKAMLFANYPKAGGVTYLDGKAQYTGQLGVAMAMLNNMMLSEPKFTDTLGREVDN